MIGIKIDGIEAARKNNEFDKFKYQKFFERPGKSFNKFIDEL
jgi:hypothetical protein